MTAPLTEDRPQCRTCQRATVSPICAPCGIRAGNQLGELPSLMDQLAYATVPGGGGIGEWVSGGAFESRPPVSVDALTLIALPAHAIRIELADPQPPASESGTSIPLWVVAWAAVWRHRWGHGPTPGVRGSPTAPAPARPSQLTVPDVLADLHRHDPDAKPSPDGWSGPARAALAEFRTRRAAELGAYQADRDRQAQYLSRVMLGLNVVRVRDDTADGGWRPLTHDDDDPDVLAAHWAARFGTPRRVRRVLADLAYIHTWLDRGLVEFADADQLVLGLRSLIAAGRAAVGDRPDVVRLGRCPEPLLDRDTGLEQPCGAWLTRDPMVSRVTCSRCRAETDERGLLSLARRMQATWGASTDREAWAA